MSASAALAEVAALATVRNARCSFVRTYFYPLMIPQRRVTLKNVATAAGVHWTTVSKALRKHPSLPAETVERIRTIADQLGYRRDAALSALVEYRRTSQPVHYRETLGFITAMESPKAWQNWVTYRQFHQAFSERALYQGYTVEDFWLGEPNMSARRLSEILSHRRVQGIVIGPLTTSVSGLALDWEGFSAVALGFSLQSPGLHQAGNHHYKSMHVALGQLARRGYRRPGLVLDHHADERNDSSWRAAFLVGRAHAGLSDEVPPLVESKITALNLAAWLQTHRPDAVLCHGEYGLALLRTLGLSAPEQIGYLNLSCQENNPAISGILQNWNVVGEYAADFLIGMRQRNEHGIPRHPVSLWVPGTWIEGATVRPPAG